MFPVSGHFLLSRTSFASLRNILRGAMIPVNGGLVILPHVCDDLRSVRSGRVGELLAEDSDTWCKGKQENWDQKKNATLLHTA